MTQEKHSETNLLKASLTAICGFIFFSVMCLFIKIETAEGATIEWVVFIQFLSSFIIILIPVIKNKFKPVKTGKLKIHIIRGVSGLLAFSLFTIAVSKIPLVNASLLNNSAPIFVPVITLLWLRKKIDEKIWWGILVGFTGILFILHPGAGDFLKGGDLYGLGAGISLAVAYVAMGELTKSESFITILFYYTLIAVIVSLPFAMMNWSDPPLRIWIFGFLSGAFFSIYLFLLQYAFRFAEPVKLSPMNYSVVVFTGILDWLIYDQVPGLISLIGILLVTSGGILAIILHEKDNKELKHSLHG